MWLVLVLASCWFQWLFRLFPLSLLLSTCILLSTVSNLFFKNILVNSLRIWVWLYWQPPHASQFHPHWSSHLMHAPPPPSPLPLSQPIQSDLCFPKYSWVWGWPWSLVNRPPVTPLKKTDSPSPGSYQVSKAGTSCLPPLSLLRFCLAWARPGLLLAVISSCVFCCAPCRHQHLWLFPSFLLVFHKDPQASKEEWGTDVIF